MMDDWRGLYREGWQGEIVPEAFCHPAKFARGLIRHIYRHLLDEGLIQPGDTVCDPFAGVALGALDAMRQGLHWMGVELEPRFVDLGQQNIDLWLNRYAAAFPGWGTARLVQGDSRELARVLGGAGGCVSSPPWTNKTADGGWQLLGKYAEGGRLTVKQVQGNKHKSYPSWSPNRDTSYGITDGNLGNLPPGDLAAAISSPPYVEQATNGARPNRVTNLEKAGIDAKRWLGEKRCTQGRSTGYGQSPGQLGAMPGGGFDAAVASPPFAESATKTGGRQGKGWYSGQDLSQGMNRLKDNYEKMTSMGDGDTFWTAARIIVAQLHQVLRPGAPAVWVVKAFVRKGERVDFPGQWRQLCEACGFETLHQHRAWLVEDRGAQWGLFGDLHENTVERKSFFRRLAERKGAPRIDWEVVLCMRKPEVPTH